MLHVILSVLPINFKIAADNCKSSNSKHTYFRPVHVAFFAEDINATEQTLSCLGIIFIMSCTNLKMINYSFE